MRRNCSVLAETAPRLYPAKTIAVCWCFIKLFDLYYVNSKIGRNKSPHIHIFLVDKRRTLGFREGEGLTQGHSVENTVLRPRLSSCLGPSFLLQVSSRRCPWQVAQVTAFSFLFPWGVNAENSKEGK